MKTTNQNELVLMSLAEQYRRLRWPRYARVWGFRASTHQLLRLLLIFAVRYLCDLGKTASFYANLAGTVRETVEYVESAEEIPFAQPLSNFPVIQNLRMTPSFAQMGETPVFKHIPAWLPAFPDPHTYIYSPIWNERATDPRADKIELARQQRKAEMSLLSLQQRLVCNGLAVASTSVDEGNDWKALQVAETKSPFLATPLRAEEDDDSPVALPAKLAGEAIVENHVSVLETFAPAIEAVKGAFCDSGDSEKKVLPDKRRAVHLPFKTGKKLLGECFDLSLRNKGSGKSSSWIGRDDEKDDKKRRAELILRQSMENPQELTQL
ncbi:hypothetical protein F0562_016925 [Nyssa sinensis]|uniref:Transcription initiation factor TFIID subunit 8 n=1 Tax=Nyssa sinensis TaxID=561372 RepID=A0A5J4ZF01_9ASTE|nr:hypothetical protein F0562_016925 [Nyssa sinensis]